MQHRTKRAIRRFERTWRPLWISSAGIALLLSIGLFAAEKLRPLVSGQLLISDAQAASKTIPAEISVCFTPEEECEDLIVGHIERANREILVMAYTFTAKPIMDALLRAQARGVTIEVIMDAKAAEQRYSMALPLQMARIPLWLDSSVAIMHNKILILDRQTVITGSYNLSKAAASKNAENVVTMNGGAAIARPFIDNFSRRKAAAERVIARQGKQ